MEKSAKLGNSRHMTRRRRIGVPIAAPAGSRMARDGRGDREERDAGRIDRASRASRAPVFAPLAAGEPAGALQKNPISAYSNSASARFTLFTLLTHGHSASFALFAFRFSLFSNFSCDAPPARAHHQRRDSAPVSRSNHRAASPTNQSQCLFISIQTTRARKKALNTHSKPNIRAAIAAGIP